MHPFNHSGALFFRKELHKAVANLGAVRFCNANARFFHLLHLATKIVSGGRNSGNSDGRALPHNHFIQLRNRHVEPVAEDIFQAANALAPIF